MREVEYLKALIAGAFRQAARPDHNLVIDLGNLRQGLRAKPQFRRQP